MGCGVLWGIRGWRWWTDLIRLAGVAYLLGLASLVIVLSLELSVGVPFGVGAIVGGGGALVGGGVLLGGLSRRPLPRLRSPSWRFPTPSVFTALFVAAIGVYFEAFFRWGRLQGAGADWDAWRVWTLRAKGIYYFGRIEETIPSLGAYPSYPPGLSSMQAAAFHAMGSADVVTLHLLNWFVALGFVAALAGLLATRVRPTILLPFLLALLVMPRALPEWGTRLMADLPLGYLLSIAALLIVLWLDDRATWRLMATSILLAGAMLTKREGLVIALVVIVAGLVATSREARRAWLPLAATGIAAVALALPWRIWVTYHGVGGAQPADGGELEPVGDLVTGGDLASVGDLDRVWPSLKLVVETLFDYDFWLVVPVLSVSAAVLALLVGRRKEAVYLLSFVVVAIVASAFVIWSTGFEITQDFGLNPVGRLVGSPVLVIACLTPLLLERAWAAAPTELAAVSVPRLPRMPSAAGWMIILVAVLGYPASMLVGPSALALPGGLPKFPGPGDCSHPPDNAAQVRLVLGYEKSHERAFALRDRAVKGNFRSATTDLDGCGRVRVSVEGISSSARARDLLARALEGGFHAVLEDGRSDLGAMPDETPIDVHARTLPSGSCHEAAGKRLLGDRPMFHLRRIGGRERDGWAIEGLGWITEGELTFVNGGARIVPASGGPGFAAGALRTC